MIMKEHLLRTRDATFVCVLVVTLFATPVLGTMVEPPATRQSLSKVWIARDQGITARLQLDASGTGTLIVYFGPGSPACAFRVTKTFLAGYALSLTIVPVDPDPDGLVLNGRADLRSLNLELRGTAGTANGIFWRLRFEPYDHVLRDLRAVDSRAAALQR
jgi:hypothetical protein